MHNENLKEKYEKVYSEGKEKYFSRFINGVDTSEVNSTVWELFDWTDKRVLDIGCGTGDTIAGIAEFGASQALGVDYSEHAIEEAKNKHNFENLKFIQDSFDDNILATDELYDIVISLGTLEHMSDPKFALHSMLKLVEKEGKLVLTCPYFINVRGIVWMTLALALKVPMSLTDKHFISPFDIRRWLKGSGYKLSDVKYFDHRQGNGDLMLSDLDKRLKNALKDASLPVEYVNDLMSWLENVVRYESGCIKDLNGSTALYIIEKKNG